ncbi:MAG: leucine-rich repeat protein [Clostridia bacterium]|nr:leucine-rich repeat protein [Clostridia bacterium]
MRNLFKKLFALLLCAAMLLALLPAFAAAEDDPATELPEVEDAEPADEEPADATLFPEDEVSPDAEPTGSAKDGGTIVVVDEELVSGTNTFTINTPGETVYRPVRPKEDGYHAFSCQSVWVHFADSELNEIARSNGKRLFVYLHAGETYYFGISHVWDWYVGTFTANLEVYPANACGESSTFAFEEDTGTLRFYGSGDMWSFEPDTAPWAAFKDRIKTVDFRDSTIKKIGGYAFYNHENLTSALFKTDFPWVGEYAFYGTGIREVNLHWAAQPYSFANCKNLETVTLSHLFCSTICEHAFENSGVKTILLNYATTGNTAMEIKAYAFANCTELQTADFKDCLSSVGAHAFENSGLIRISESSKLRSVGAYAYANCPNLITAQLPVLSSTEPPKPGVIPEGLFKNSGIQSLYIPKNVETIEKDALYGCTKLAPDALTVDPENKAFTAKDGLILTKDGKTTQLAVPSLTECTIPFGVQTIAGQTFYSMPLLTDVTLQPGVKVIEMNAFRDCPALESISIPTSLSTVQAGAFINCEALSDVYYLGTEAERNAKLTVEDDNDALLYAEWHYQEPCSFDGTIEWNAEDVQMKGTTPYVVYNGSAFTPRFTLLNAEGEAVDPETYSVAYQENINAGTGYAFVTFTEGYTGTLRLFFKIYLPATTETTVENVENGIRISWEPVEGAAGYVIYRRAWNLIDAGWTTFERWNNTPNLVWTDTTVYAGTRYQYGVKAYFDRRMDPVTGAIIGGNVGDNFNLGVVGPLKTTVRITTRHLNSLQPGYGTITANWDPSKVFTGYQLKYATNEAFTKNVKSVKINDAKTQSTVLRSLTNGTAYFVCIRSYHEFAGMTYFGQWSNVIRVKPGSGQTMYDVMYRALVIGENNYSGNQALKGPIRDMNAMSGMLKGLKRPFNVTTLPNSNRSAIMNAIKTTYADAMDNDVSVFYYSGHGADAHGDETYQGALVPIDENYITMKDLAAELSKVRGRVIVILDSCMSGAAIERSAGGSFDAFNQSVIDAFSGYWLEPGDTEAGTARMGELRKSKFIVITAASAYRSSYEGKFDGSGYDQGAFTAAFIKGLGCSYPYGSYSGSMPADTNKNKQITLYEIYNYAYEQAYRWTGQSAQYYGTDSEVLFRR